MYLGSVFRNVFKSNIGSCPEGGESTAFHGALADVDCLWLRIYLYGLSVVGSFRPPVSRFGWIFSELDATFFVLFQLFACCAIFIFILCTIELCALRFLSTFCFQLLLCTFSQRALLPLMKCFDFVHPQPCRDTARNKRFAGLAAWFEINFKEELKCCNQTKSIFITCLAA